MTVYEYFNTITEEGYAGQTVRALEERDKEHQRDLKNGKHCNPRFQRAYDKYGKDAFKLIIRSTHSTVDELNKAEKVLLKKEKHRLYNIAPGGNGGFLELEAKRTISEGLKRPMMAMNIETGEIKEYSSGFETVKDGFDPRAIGGSCRLSVYESDKYKTYSRISHHGWVWMYKKDFSPEEMERRRQLAIRGKIVGERPVAGKKLVTGEFVSFISAQEAKRSLGFRTQLNRVCEFKNGNKTAGGYVWVYADISGWEDLLQKRFEEISQKGNGKRMVRQFTPIIAVDIITRKTVEFFSMKDMESKGFSHKCVYPAISGNRKSFKGLVWFYKENCTEKNIETKIALTKMYGRRN